MSSLVFDSFLSHFLQSELDNIKAEFEKLKDSSLHQRKKMTEIMASLMKDMSEIGSVVGGNANEFKVRLYLGQRMMAMARVVHICL